MNEVGNLIFDLTGSVGDNAVRGIGWSIPEPAGVWNDGVQATLGVTGLVPYGRYTCQLAAQPHISRPQVPQQRLIVLMRGNIVFDGAMTEPGSVSFPVVAGAGGDLTLQFRFPDAISPRALGSSIDSRRLALMMTRLAFILAADSDTEPESVIPPPAQPTLRVDDIVFMQTADATVYKPMLDMTARVNILYCRKHDIRYESYVGIKKGVVPWQATYNRIFMLHELLQRDFRGWAAFVDADAFVVDLSFDLRTYLASNSKYCLIGATGGTDVPWNLNAGVLFINLGDDDGRAFVNDWLERFNAVVPVEFLASPDAAWEDHLNDQALMYDSIRLSPNILRKTKKEDRALFNYLGGTFIKQALRAGFSSLLLRMDWIRNETAKVLEAERLRPTYVDLTNLANRYGSDKGTDIGNKHGYTLFYQFLFESFRTEEFNFLELGLLRGGPEVGGSNDRVGNEVPSVRMWLDYFPHAVCHGFDISDFSAVKLDRFQFHRGDLGSVAHLAALRAGLPHLRFLIDDASHASYHQQLAFATLFPLVESGGYYIIEDLDWQPEAYERELPRCRLTRDLLLDFAQTRRLNIDFLPEAERRILASRIGSVHIQRRRGDGMVKLVALQKLY